MLKKLVFLLAIQGYFLSSQALANKLTTAVGGRAMSIFPASVADLRNEFSLQAPVVPTVLTLSSYSESQASPNRNPDTWFVQSWTPGRLEPDPPGAIFLASLQTPPALTNAAIQLNDSPQALAATPAWTPGLTAATVTVPAAALPGLGSVLPAGGFSTTVSPTVTIQMPPSLTFLPLGYSFDNPEPTTFWLAGGALLFVLLWRWRSRWSRRV
jgi:hypothetical protein